MQACEFNTKIYIYLYINKSESSPAWQVLLWAHFGYGLTNCYQNNWVLSTKSEARRAGAFLLI